MKEHKADSETVLCCFTMARNESPILDPYLDQLNEFFDHSIVLDHDSTDNSQDLVRQRVDTGKFSLFHLKAAGYPQSEVATYFVKHLISEKQADYVFFLDCDEFLPFASRDELLQLIKTHQDDDVLLFNWRNICPGNLNGNDIFSSEFLQGPHQKEICKIAISATITKNAPNFSIDQGYHGVSPRDGRTLQVSNDPIAELLSLHQGFGRCTRPRSSTKGEISA